MTKRKILIPLDGSDFSRQILTAVRAIFTPDTTEVTLLRVGDPPKGLIGRPARPASADVPVPMYESSTDLEYAQHPVYASQEYDSAIGTMKDELQPDVQQLTDEGYTVSTAVKFGNAAHEIIEFVTSENMDAIAMTTHGRSGLERVLSGSVAEEVLRHVRVPILLIHSSDETTPDNFPSDVVAAAHLGHG